MRAAALGVEGLRYRLDGDLGGACHRCPVPAGSDQHGYCSGATIVGCLNDLGVELLRQHAGLGVDVEHRLDAVEVRLGSRFAREVVGLEQIGVEHRDRRLGHLGDDLERLVAVRHRLAHAGGEITHVGANEIGVLVDEVFAAHLHDVHDVLLLVLQREQLAQAALGLRARGEGLVEHAHVDAPGADCVLGGGEAGLDQLDVLLGVDAVALEQQRHRAIDAGAEYVDADALALHVGDGLDRGVVLYRPVDREAARLLAHVLRNDVSLEIGLDRALRHRQHALGRAIERACRHRLHHRRGALELHPFDLVALAEIGKLIRTAHHPVFRFLGRDGPAHADGLLRPGHGRPEQGGRRCQREHQCPGHVVSRSLSPSRKVAARTRRGGRPARKTPAAGRACTSNSTTMKAYEK